MDMDGFLGVLAALHLIQRGQAMPPPGSGLSVGERGCESELSVGVRERFRVWGVGWPCCISYSALLPT